MSPPVIKVSVLTTPPSLKLKLLPKPVVQVKAVSRFPSSVTALSPILLDRAGGNYTFSLDIAPIIASLPPGGVGSVFGRTGDVTAQSGDYTFAQIGSKPTTLSGYGIIDAQPLDADLTALASNSTDGLWARTGSGTGAARTITGTANQITVTNGDGAAGNPTLSIPSNAALPGAPTTTTAAVDDNSTKIATTAMVIGQAAAATPLGNAATAVVGTSTRFARADHVHPGREQLTANRTYYVRTDGSNSNTGLVNSAGGAFLTIQKAVDIVSALDISIYTVTITVVAGTYTAGATVTGPWVGSGTVLITGDTTTPANVVVNATGDAFVVSNGGRLTIGGFKVTSTGIALHAATGGVISSTGLMEFGANSSYYAYGETNGAVNFTANFTCSGSAFAAFGTASFGTVNISSRAATISGTPAYGAAFAAASVNGLIVANGFSFSGAGATGPRYSATTAGGIFTFGGGASFFPGNSAGSATAPGWYN